MFRPFKELVRLYMSIASLMPRQISFKYLPREYQLPFLKAMANGCKRAAIVWHRRAGKDLTVLNLLVTEALKRVGTYFYFFPTFNQGRKILWDGMDKDGNKFLSYIPDEVIAVDEAGRKKKNETEMQIELVNGSIIQVVGTDKIDNIVGTNPIGCVFSEYSLQNPAAWDLVRPILAENGGFAVFVYTPRGKNHGWELYKDAVKLMHQDQSWFAQVLTVNDTRRPDGSPVVTPEQIQAERDAGMDEDMIQQEFYCSFSGSQVGSYWGSELSTLRNTGRIRSVPWIPSIPVYTAWDLGYGDANAIWFAQLVRPEVHVIDFYMASSQGLPHYAKVVKAKPYVYGCHLFPHDIKVHEWSSGNTRIKAAREMQLEPARVVKKVSPKDRIDAARRLLPRCVFDAEKCDTIKYQIGSKKHTGLDCLMEYRKEYDPEKAHFLDTAVHNWASNGADSFSYLAVGIQEQIPLLQTQADTAFNVFDEQNSTAQYSTDFNVFGEE